MKSHQNYNDNSQDIEKYIFYALLLGYVLVTIGCPSAL